MKDMEDQGMFKNVKAGDSIAVVESFTLTKHVRIKSVARVTATQIHLEDGEKFSRETGVAIGHKNRSSSKRISDTHDKVVLGELARVALDRFFCRMGQARVGYPGYSGIIKLLN